MLPLATGVQARSHRVFGGKLDRSTLGFAERAICTALRAPEGDFRDFAEIRGWALGIAESLHKQEAALSACSSCVWRRGNRTMIR